MEGGQTGHQRGGKRGGREGRWKNSGNETDGRQKQDGGMQTTEETESCVQTEMGGDTGLKTPPGHYLLEPSQTLELISRGAGWRE